MIIEMKLARTYHIWIDGVSPEKKWDVTDNADGAILMHERDSREPLKVGPHRIESITFDPPQQDWHSENLPKKASAVIDGKDVELEITSVILGGEGEPTKKRVGQDEIEIDEITAYIKLEVS